MLNNSIFERTEVKYMLSAANRSALFSLIQEHMREDSYGKSTICNLYFDTDNFQMIRTSMEKPIYKEKLRLRSYGVPHASSKVFLELKKKYKGVVYKRRESLTLKEVSSYIQTGKKPKETQIMDEIHWTMKAYPGLKPAMYISYDREAFYCIEDENLRITFDSNLLYRTEDLSLEKGIYGVSVIDSGFYIMEIKALNAMPLWLTSALNQLSIYPASFSKYGEAYKQTFLLTGGRYCA